MLSPEKLAAEIKSRPPVALIHGTDDDNRSATRVMAHLDELSMLVKRIEPDGTLHVTQLGTMYPANFGLGPVAVLGDRQTLTGVLAVGSEHTTKESRRIWETKPDQGDKSLDWLHVYVFTGCPPEELVAAAEAEALVLTAERAEAETEELRTALGAGGTGKGTAGAMRGATGAIKDLERRQKSRQTRAARDALDRALIDLATYFRDALVVSANAGGVRANHPDMADRVGALAAHAKPDRLLRCIEAVLQCREALAVNVKPKFAVDAMVATIGQELR